MRVFVVALLAGYALLVTAMVFLGLVLIHVVLPIGGLGEADEDVSQWLADNRSPTQEDVSWVGSTLAGGHVIPAVIGLCLVVLPDHASAGSSPPSSCSSSLSSPGPIARRR